MAPNDFFFVRTTKMNTKQLLKFKFKKKKNQLITPPSGFELLRSQSGRQSPV